MSHPISAPGKRNGVSIRDQWKRAGRYNIGKRWLYRVWNLRTKSYVSETFPHDPTAKRRLAGCADGDQWAEQKRLEFLLESQEPGLTPAPTGASAGATAASASTSPSDRQSAFITPPIGSETTSLAWIGSQFLESRKDSERSAGHLQAIVWTLHVFAHAGVDDLTHPHLIPRFQAHLKGLIAQRPGQKGGTPVSPRVKNHHINILRSIAEYALKRGWLPQNPFLALEPYTEPKHDRVVYPIDDLRTMLRSDHQNHPWWRFVVLAIYTGFRSENVRALTWEMVDFKRERFLIHIAKTQRDSRPNIQPELLDLLRSWEKSGGPLIPDYIRDATSDRANEMTQKFLHACGLEKVGRSVHTFRHTVASLLTATGTGAFSVMEAVGHESTVTSRHYSKGASEFRYQVESEGWDEGHFYLRGIPPALNPFSIGHLESMISKERTPSPVWLLCALTIYLGMPATSLVKLRREQVPKRFQPFRDPFDVQGKEFSMPTDIDEIFLRAKVPANGYMFPLSWRELSRERLAEKIESYWEDIHMSGGKRRAGALDLSVLLLRQAVGLPSTIEGPSTLRECFAQAVINYREAVKAQNWDEDELWVLDAKRSYTTHEGPVG
jgi:integrase